MENNFYRKNDEGIDQLPSDRELNDFVSTTKFETFKGKGYLQCETDDTSGNINHEETQKSQQKSKGIIR